MPNHMMNICGKFCQNPSTKQRDIISHSIALMDDWSHVRPENIMSPIPVAGRGIKMESTVTKNGELAFEMLTKNERWLTVPLVNVLLSGVQRQQWCCGQSRSQHDRHGHAYDLRPSPRVILLYAEETASSWARLYHCQHRPNHNTT